MLCVSALPVLLALSSLGPDEISESRLLKFAQKRSQIRSGEFDIRIHLLVNREEPKFAGADWRYHYWFTSDRSKFRLDRRLQNDKRLTKSDETSKYSYDGRVYRLIDQLDDRKRPLREYRKIIPKIVPELYDVRLLGLHVDSFTVLHNFTMKDLERIVTNATSLKTEALADGGVRETYLHDGGLRYRYYFSPAGVPLSFDAEGHPGTESIRYEARFEYAPRSPEFLDLPARIEFKRFTDHRLTQHEVVELTVARLNEPIDDKICSWESLDPTPGTLLSVNNNYYHMDTLWNGSKFVPYVPTTWEVFPQEARRGKNATALVVWFTATCLLGLLLIRAFRKAGVRSET